MISSRAQSPFYHFFEDSILPGYRVSGEMDSSDVYSIPYASTSPQFLQPSIRPFGLNDFQLTPQFSTKRRFSAIPHLGFVYSMGSNAQQLGRISYTQATDSFNFVQVDYLRYSTNGAMRNQSMKRNQVELSWLHRGVHYGSALKLNMLSLEQGLNGGLLDDSIQNDFGLEFQDVKKANASQKYIVVKSSFENFYSLTANSNLKTGIYITPFLNVTNRRYFESDSLPQIYGSTNSDTATTQDFWQRGEIGAKAGYFFHTKPFVLNAGAEVKYWDFDNFSVHNDTTEIAITGDLIVDLKSGWNWSNTAKINLIGALGEFGAKSKLSKQSGNFRIGLDADLGRRFPQNFQRNYFGNTVKYSWTNKVLETYFTVNGRVNLKLKGQSINVFGGIDQRFNMPLFLNNQWRQDTLTNLSLAKVGGSINFQWRSLLFQPKVTAMLSNLSIVPSIILQGRLAYNGTLFKAKKLRTATGIDFGYSTSYSTLLYVPMMDAYSLNAGTTTFFAMPKLHFFTQFDLGYFRWFIRVENIEQSFQKEKNMDAVGYPLLPMQLRFGVSWDLFN